MRNALRVVLLVAFAAAALVVLGERPGATSQTSDGPTAAASHTTTTTGPAAAPTTTAGTTEATTTAPETTVPPTTAPTTTIVPTTIAPGTTVPDTTGTPGGPTTTTGIVPRRGIPLAEAIAGSIPPRFARATPAVAAFAGCVAKEQRSPAEFDAAIARSSWPREQWEKVCRVVACESMWRADARRSARRGAVRYLGYLQIEDRSWRPQYNAMGYDDAAMLTPLPNLEVGYWLWSTVGGSRWSKTQWDCASA
jgi:hypothetical protein